MHPAIQKWYENRRMEEVLPEDVRRIRAAYYGMVEYVDSLIGKILDTIEKTVGWENTVVIYGSDHGDNIGEHGLFWKTNFYEGAAHVPMVYVYKNVFPENRRIKGVTSLLDVAPTVLDLAQAESLPECDGISLLSNLKTAEAVDENREVVSVCSDIKGDNPSAMLRWKNYKLVKHAGYTECQLFDLDSDPGEEQDLGTDPAYREIAEKLEGSLSGYWDGDAALKSLERDKFHFRMMKKWYDIVNPEVIEEWRGNPENNYLA